MPSRLANNRSVRFSSSCISRGESSLMSGCVKVWFPISWPSCRMRDAMGRNFSVCMPIRKNVAKRAVFGTQPPQRKSTNPERARGPHLVESAYRIEEPDVMAVIVLIAIAEMWIQAVAVEIYIFLGIARRQPGFLHGDGLVDLSRWKLAFVRLLAPVVAVVRDGANQFVQRDHLLCVYQICGEPIL